MAFFGVTAEKLKNVINHPNADRLDICTFENNSFQVISLRNEYKTGDFCLYFPLDGIIPESILEKLGLKEKLSGKNKDRVKTVRLRGELSQGIAAPISLLNDFPNWKNFVEKNEFPSSEAITEFLGILKYEPPEIFFGGYHRGSHITLPCGLPVYDIEGCDVYPKLVKYLMDKMVFITEKVEGSNISITYSASEKKSYVNTRRHSLLEKEGETSPYWDVAREYGLVEFAKDLSEDINNVTIYGEFLGPKVQGNYYQFTKYNIRLFDIKINDRYMEPEKFFNIILEFNLRKNRWKKYEIYPKVKTVPLLSYEKTLEEWLDGKTVQEASNGKSMLINKLREGIVIVPCNSEYSKELNGRLILKQRSPKYLEND